MGPLFIRQTTSSRLLRKPRVNFGGRKTILYIYFDIIKLIKMIALKTLGREEPSCNRKWNIKSRNLLFPFSGFCRVTLFSLVETKRAMVGFKFEKTTGFNWSRLVLVPVFRIALPWSPFPSRRTNLSFSPFFFCFVLFCVCVFFVNFILLFSSLL